MHNPAPALGRRFLWIVLFVAVLPLGAIGLLAIQSASRSGRTLLRSQLDAELLTIVREVEKAWEGHKSELLMLGESEPMRQRLRAPLADGDTAAPAFTARAFAQMTAFDQVVIRDVREEVRVTLTSAYARTVDVRGDPRRQPATVAVRIPVIDLLAGDTIGSVEALVRMSALVAATSRPISRAGPLLAVEGPAASGVRPIGVDPAIFTDESALWEGEQWTTVRDTLNEPRLVLSLAGALSPYQRPFASAMQRSAMALLAVSALVALLIMVLTRRLARDVERQIAQREALATVGEFASELAHEVRNPLTAMRLDLQRVQEHADDPAIVGTVLPRVLGQIDRLDRAVTGALRVTRGGSIEPQLVDVHSVLEAARRSAEPEFVRRGARLVLEASDARLSLAGDAGALEQLFLNLFINAAQALSSSGEARVSTSLSPGVIEVVIADSGAGMSPEQLVQAQEPLRSTRRDGTGLGLKIARRIVASHRGEMAFLSAPGVGTTVRVRLPGG